MTESKALYTAKAINTGGRDGESQLAYNIVNFMKTICFPSKEAAFQVDTLRL